MHFKKWVKLACALLVLTLSRSAMATDLNPFEYTGNQETLLRLMQNEAGNGTGGSGVFADAGFQSNMVNIFLADLSGADSGLSNAGTTLFVMWGNGVDPGGVFSANVTFNNNYSEGTDGHFTEGISQIFALGDGVNIINNTISFSSAGDGGIGGTVHGNTTPLGFAITNLQNMSEGEILLIFDSLAGSIQDVGLFDYGNSDPTMLYGDLNIPLPLVVVPLPPPLGLAIAGLFGVILMRRRFIHS